MTKSNTNYNILRKKAMKQKIILEIKQNGQQKAMKQKIWEKRLNLRKRVMN